MISRIISLLSAITLSLTLLFTTSLLQNTLQGTGQGILILALLGIAGGFVHGIGLTPRLHLLRLLFSPWVSWPLMSIASFLY